MWICGNCGQRNQDENSFCGNCGRKRESGNGNYTGGSNTNRHGGRKQKEPVDNNKRLKILLCGAAALAVILLVCILLSGPKDSGRTEKGSSGRADSLRYECIVPTVNGFIAVKSDGTVHTSGLEEEYSEAVLMEVDSWKDIVDIKRSYNGIMGLKSNGTVVFAGDDERSKAVAEWKNVKAIDMSYGCLYGLKSDGTVLSLNYEIEPNKKVSGWKNIKQIKATRCDAGEGFLALTKDGQILSAHEGGEFTLEWSGKNSDVVAIESSGWLHVGLKSDGTVICAGIDKNVVAEEVDDWRNVKQLCPGDTRLLALTESGEVLAAGYIDGLDPIYGWENVKRLYCSEYNAFVAGVWNDGTIECLYREDDDYENWRFMRSSGVSELGFIDDYGRNPRVIGLSKDGELFVHSFN